MKEIQKVVQKLSHEQESAAGGAGTGGGRRHRTNRYKNIKSPPVYQGDLINIHQLNLYPRMYTFDGKLVFHLSNNLISYGSPLKARDATRTPNVPRVCVA